MKKVKILMVFVLFLFVLSYFAVDISNKQLAYEAQKEAFGTTHVGTIKGTEDIASQYAGNEYYEQYMHDTLNPLEVVDNVMEAFGPDGYLNQGF